jgi:hypothetical protein
MLRPILLSFFRGASSWWCLSVQFLDHDEIHDQVRESACAWDSCSADQVCCCVLLRGDFDDESLTSHTESLGNSSFCLVLHCHACRFCALVRHYTLISQPLYVSIFHSMNAPVIVNLDGETDPLKIAQKELRFSSFDFGSRVACHSVPLHFLAFQGAQDSDYYSPVSPRPLSNQPKL